RAVGIPLVNGDRGRRAAVGKVADHQQVAGLMRAGEARTATDAVGAEPDRALKEPEPLLRVAAIVQTIRAEEDDVADGCVPTRAVGARRQGVTDREGMQQGVFVRQAASSVLPGPLVDVLRGLRAATCTNSGIERRRRRVLAVVGR